MRTAALAVVLLGAAIACEPERSKPEVPILYGLIDTADVPSAAELLRPIECAGFELQLRSISRALRPRACELAQQLWSAIRDGGAASAGLSRGDTALVRCGWVGRPFVTDARKFDARSAVVSFGLRDRDYSVVAHVDPTGRIARIERSEPHDDCPRDPG